MKAQKINDALVARWVEIERNAMPGFFRAKERLDVEDLDRHSRLILRDVSFLTPHFMHGWAVGVEGRKFYPEKTMNFAGEFETGYITGWCQMDEAMKKEGLS